MNFAELLEKYQALFIENSNLKIEISNLRAQLGIVDYQADLEQLSDQESMSEETLESVLPGCINTSATPNEKIKLFMSLFKGRDAEDTK